MIHLEMKDIGFHEFGEFSGSMTAPVPSVDVSALILVGLFELKWVKTGVDVST